VGDACDASDGRLGARREAQAAYERMLSGKARFRVVLEVGAD
jgi:hypothetical protein